MLAVPQSLRLFRAINNTTYMQYITSRVFLAFLQGLRNLGVFDVLCCYQFYLLTENCNTFNRLTFFVCAKEF